MFDGWGLSWTLPLAPRISLLAEIALEPVWGWWAAVPLLLILLASLWLTLTVPGISGGRRTVLLLLRLAAIALLMIGWLRPSLVQVGKRQSTGAIAVLMDQSQSMTLASERSDQSRWLAQKEVWDSIVASTDLKIGEMSIVPYMFDSTVHVVESNDLPSLGSKFKSPPAGRATDLGEALASIGRIQTNPALRGVVLISDSVQTVVPSRFDPVQTAKQMAQLDQPILLVGVGARSDQGQVRDVAIEAMPEHFSAFLKKRMTVAMVIQAQGVQNQPIQVQLVLKSANRPDRIVGSRQVLASGPIEKVPIEFQLDFESAGEFLLTAEARVESTEVSKGNNSAVSFVTVREGGARILYIEGSPRAEQLFLKRSLNESLDFDTDYLMIPERTRKTWPIDLQRNVNLSTYDAIIIGDLDASALSSSTMNAIASHCRGGGGVLLLGGYHSFQAGGYGESPLAGLIPFDTRGVRQSFDAPVNEALHIRGPVRLTPTRPHPITTLANEPDNTRIWNSLTPLKGMNRLGELSRAPGTQVLLVDNQGEPALVTGEFGGGRVLAFAGDTTYQWFLAGDRQGQQTVHKQFWRQAMLWLIGRDRLNEGVRLSLERRRYQVDEVPKLHAEWFGGSDQTPVPANITFDVFRDGRLIQPVDMMWSENNTSDGDVVGVGQPGLYNIVAKWTNAAGEAATAEIAFIVRDESIELMQTAADWPLMRNIVEANSSAGGQLLFPEEIGRAIGWLRERQQETTIETMEKRRLGDAAWDSWLVLVLFVALMSTEWGLRKLWQLP